MTRRPWAATLVALLGPAVIAAWGVGELFRPPTVSGKAAAFEARIDRAQPDVVVLGSSLAQTNVRLDLLAEALDVPRERVVMLTLPNATAAHWYAILNNRVLARGHQPRLVVVVGALSTFVTPDLLKDTNVERLINQLGPDEPVLGPKVFGTNSPATFRLLFLRERAGAARDAFLNGWRDRVLGLAFAGGRRAAGARLAARANEVVFPPEALDFDLHRSQATGLGVAAAQALSLDGLHVGTDSLLPDMGALAKAHGVRLVWVRTPFPPSNQALDAVPEDLEADAVEVITDSGAEWLDLRGLGLGESDYQDMRHMNREGATRFTRALADALGGADALRRGRSWTLPRVVGRVDAQGDGRAEGAAVLRPGQPLTVDFEGAWRGAPEDFVVWLRGDSAGPVALTVAAGGAEVGVEATGLDAALDLPAPRAERWSLTLTAEPGSAEVRLRELGVGRPPQVVPILGRVEDLSGASARVIGGRTDDTLLSASFASPPPEVAPSGAVREGPRARGAAASALWVLPVEPYAALADASHVHAAWPQQCTPLRLTVAGATLSPWARQDELKSQAGAVLHAGGALYFSRPARGAAEDVALSLDPDRACRGIEIPGGTPLRGALWLYPSDVAEVAVPQEALAGLSRGATALDLEVELLGASPGWVEVSVLVDGRFVGQARVDGTPGALRRRHLSLDVPVARDAKVVLRFRRDASPDAWWRVRRAALVEPPAEALRRMQESRAPEAQRVPKGGSVLPAGARRLGRPPEVPVESEGRRDGVVRWRVPAWWMVSDAALERDVGVQASPVGVRDAAGWLDPVPRADFEACDRCRVHVGALVAARATGALELGLDDRLPTPNASGAPAWWLWPGGSLVWTPAWEAQGDVATVYARVRSFGGRRGPGPAPSLRLGERELSLQPAGDGIWEGSVTAPPGEVHLHLDADAPFAWVEVLRTQTAGAQRELLGGPR